MRISVWNVDDCLSGGLRAFDVKPTRTVVSFKALIGRTLSLSPSDMQDTMLVPDRRNLRTESGCPSTLADGRDLLHGSSPTATLDQCGIKDGDFLRVGFKGPFLIRLKSSPRGGKDHDIKVSCSDTVRVLKEKIRRITGAAVGGDDFPEVFLRPCAGDRTLLSFGIFNLSPHSSPRCQHTMYRNRENKSFHQDHHLVYPFTWDDDEKVGDGDEKLQIVVEFPNMPWRFPLMCKPTDTIRTVKNGIIRDHMIYGQLTGQSYIKKGLFVLYFGSKLLKVGSKTLASCGINHMDSIQVFEDASFSVIISTTHGHIEIEMKCFDKVGTLGQKIQDATGIPKKEQRLVYKGWYLDNKARYLVDYGIVKPVRYDKICTLHDYENGPFWDRPNEEFRIHLLASSDESTASAIFSEEDHSTATKMIQITVEVANTPWRFPLTFEPTDTIDTVRKGIIEECCRRGGPFDQSYIKAGMFVLGYGPNQLEEESITLDERGIRHTDSVRIFEEAYFDIEFISPEYMGLSAKKRRYGPDGLLRGGDRRISVRFCSTVGMLKEKIQAVTGIPKEGQRLKYSEVYVDWILDDDKGRLLDYGISKQVECDDGFLFPENPMIFVESGPYGEHGCIIF